MIVMIDTGICNLSSVHNAIKRVGVSVHSTSDRDDLANAEAIVLPGVGAFGECMQSLRNKDLVEPIRDRVLNDRVPIIGICLGMQLLASSSEEHGEFEGLNLIPARVQKLKPNAPGFYVPNIGWCDVSCQRDSVLFPKGAQERAFYHVHSYYLECEDVTDVVATINYSGQDVAVAVERGNVFGTQFHPEKSQDAGLDLLNRFFSYLNG